MSKKRSRAADIGGLNISIQTIPHNRHRYPTCGDYWATENWSRQQIRVSEMGDWRYETLVAIHELVEQSLCRAAGIPEADIAAFDKQFEAEKEMGQHVQYDEPGMHPQALYHSQHCAAMGVEMLVAVLLGVNWSDYCRRIDQLWP